MLFKKKRYDFSFITKEFFPELTPYQINGGHCFNWCLFCFWYFNKLDIKLYSDKGFIHAFIKVDGLFYDAERPEGTKYPEELPTCERCRINKNDLIEVDYWDFIYEWGDVGKHKALIPKISRIVREYKRKKKLEKQARQ